MKTRYHTPEQIGEMLQFGTQTVYSWIKEGRLKAHKVSKRVYRISQEDFDDFIERHKVRVGGDHGKM